MQAWTWVSARSGILVAVSTPRPCPGIRQQGTLFLKDEPCPGWCLFAWLSCCSGHICFAGCYWALFSPNLCSLSHPWLPVLTTFRALVCIFLSRLNRKSRNCIEAANLIESAQTCMSSEGLLALWRVQWSFYRQSSVCVCVCVCVCVLGVSLKPHGIWMA